LGSKTRLANTEKFQ